MKRPSLHRILYPALLLMLCCLPALAQQAETPSPKAEIQEKPTLVRVLFTGDIMVHEDQLRIASRTHTEHDFTPTFESMLPYFQGKNAEVETQGLPQVLIGCLETVLGGSKLPYRGYPSFNSPDSLAEALAGAGFNILALANNHSMDWGSKAALRTRKTVEDKGMAALGLGSADTELPPDKKHGPAQRTLLYPVEGITLGLLNYTYGSNAPLTPNSLEKSRLNVINKDAISQDVAYLQEQGASFIIALFHWGIEYQLKPTDQQRELAQYCLALGVDTIIGAHPHVLQPMEMIDGKFVAWSLGNFVSAQRTLPRERSVLLALELEVGVKKSEDAEPTKPQLRRVAVLPTWVDFRASQNIARVLPALPQPEMSEASDILEASASRPSHSAALQAQLDDVREDVLSFLGASTMPSADLFYTVFELPDVQPEKAFP